MTTSELKQLRHLKREIAKSDKEITQLKELECDLSETDKLINLKTERMRFCIEQLTHLEKFISSIPDSYLRQIFELKYADGLSWTQTAHRLGCTGDSVRMACSNYLKTQNS